MKKNTLKTDPKAIRIHIKREIETKNPCFSQLKRKSKKEAVQSVCEDVGKAINADILEIPALTEEERLGLGTPPKGIMSLEKMGFFIEDYQKTVISLPNKARKERIKNPLLKCIDEILEDDLINHLLATPGMRYSRDWLPSRLLRIELLRTLLFPHLSGRKFCKYLANLEHKEERAFCNLPLHKKEMCDHSRLSVFRSSLSLTARTNLMVYLLYYFLSSQKMGSQVIHMLDSTEVAIPVSPVPLYKMPLPDGSNIRFYSDLNCDCGSRRKKRDKSSMLVGYRVHTLCVASTENRIAFPLLSLVTAANHHDSQLLEPMLTLAKAVGLELKVLSVDEAYADAEKQDKLRKQQNLFVVTPPKTKTEIPAYVEKENVFCHETCETPMHYRGYDKEDNGHVFVCEKEECFWSSTCPKERIIPIDTGLFGPLPSVALQTKEVVNIRKVTERPFNLLKHIDGLEPCRMKTQGTVASQVLFSQMIGIFHVMARLRSQPKLIPKQEVLSFAVNS